MKTKLISAAAALVTAFSVCSTSMSAFAKQQSGTVEGYFDWVLEDDVMTCVSIIKPTFTVTIDDSDEKTTCFVEGTEITDKFFNFDDLSKLVAENFQFTKWVMYLELDTLTFSDNVTTFKASLDIPGTKAIFQTISEVNLGNGLVTLGDNFIHDSAITAITLPESLESVGKNAFLNNTSLTDITVMSDKVDLTGTGIGFLNDGSKIEGVVIHGKSGSPAQTYAETNGFEFAALPGNPDDNGNNESKFGLGDVNRDGTVNALDASAVLTAYANTAVGKDSGLDDEQTILADVNGDKDVNALDASFILSYYAFIATGGNGSINDFMSK